MVPLLHTSLNSSLLESDKVRLTRAGFDRYLLSAVGVSFPFYFGCFRYVETTFSSAVLALSEIGKRLDAAGDDISVSLFYCRVTFGF